MDKPVFLLFDIGDSFRSTDTFGLQYLSIKVSPFGLALFKESIDYLLYKIRLFIALYNPFSVVVYKTFYGVASLV
mgnify:FL=1